MHVVIVSETLVTGGAETFVLRLASALQRSGHTVSLIILRGDLVNADQIRRLAADVPLKRICVPFSRLILKLDGLLYRLGLGFCLLRWIHVLRLRKVILAEHPDVVHSHLLTADLVTSKACSSVNVPWIATMHGDYLAIEAKGKSQAARVYDFHAASNEIELSVGQMVCITDQQIQQLNRLMPSLAAEGRITKIYNGYSASEDLEKLALSDGVARLPNLAFVIGMVARGIREKGWDVLVQAFEEIALPDAWLVLVGDGDHIHRLRSKTDNARIIFCGDVADPLRYISRFDIACLPSQISSESLPTVVIEYLLMGKPVIATAVGEVPAMLEAPGDSAAGILLDLGSTEVMVAEMKSALKRLYADGALRESMVTNALHAVKKFNMDRCVAAYLDVYARAGR